MGRCFLSVLVTTFFVTTKSVAYPTPFDVDGALHRWPLSPVDDEVFYEVIVDDPLLKSYLEEIVDESASIWSSVDGSRLTLSPAGNDQLAQISVYYDKAITGGDTAAGYSIFDNVDEGVPKHCTIHIAASSEMDSEGLSKTTLHELGHCIGLAHSLMPESIMSYNLDRNQFALSVDDRAALARIYPLDQEGPSLAPGCSIGSAGRAESIYNNMILYIFLTLPVVAHGVLVILRRIVRI
jgi:hypothetical protein